MKGLRRPDCLKAPTPLEATLAYALGDKRKVTGISDPRGTLRSVRRWTLSPLAVRAA